MTDKQLAEIKARVAKATVGPWKWEADGFNCEELYSTNDDEVITAGCGQNVGFVRVKETDAEFIAHARQDIPELIAEVETINQANAVLRGVTIGMSEEIAQLRKALEFYASSETYHNDFDDDYYDIFSDFGQLAREALGIDD